MSLHNGLLVLGFGFCALLVNTGAFASERQVEINPGKHQEECFALSEGDEVEFDFQAASPLLFNVHYHEGEKVVFPIAEQSRQEMATTKITAKLAQTYCLMWSNKSDRKAVLNYRYKVVIH